MFFFSLLLLSFEVVQIWPVEWIDHIYRRYSTIYFGGEKRRHMILRVNCSLNYLETSAFFMEHWERLFLLFLSHFYRSVLMSRKA